MPFQRLPVGRQARFTLRSSRGPSGIEPGLPLYQGGVLPKHLQTITSVIPDGVEPSFPACRAGVVPFDHGTASGRSRSRTDKITSLSNWPLFPFACSAVKWQVQESHLAGEGYEPSLGTGPPASESVSVAGPGIEPGHRPYESQLGASPACIALRVTKGRVELPSPDGHDVLSVACLPVAPLGQLSQSSPYGIRTRVAGLRGKHPEPLEERAVFSSSASGRS